MDDAARITVERGLVAELDQVITHHEVDAAVGRIVAGVYDGAGGLRGDVARLGIAHVPEGRGILGELSVRDHGPGISEEEAARVFERFYRADSSRYRETGGTGLGLAIVAALVAQHDGTVRLLDTEGGGATMSIRIPYEPAPDDDRSVFEYN